MDPPPIHDSTPIPDLPSAAHTYVTDLRVDVSSLKDTVARLSVTIEKLATEAHVRNVLDQSWRDACVTLAKAVGSSWIARLLLTILAARLFGIDVDLVVQWMGIVAGGGR